MIIIPETELLLLCARVELNDEHVRRLRALLETQLDWRAIFATATEHRITPLLAQHLRRTAEDKLDQGLQNELHTRHINATQNNMRFAVEILNQVELFDAHGIEVIPFKGPVLAAFAYGGLASRASGDIDLLVKPEAHARAETLLTSQGYVVKQRYNNALQSSLWHEERGIAIDLHWGVPPKALKLKTSLLWNRLEPVKILGRTVRTFSRYDTLLIMAINAVKEYWKPSLHHLSDIQVLTADYSLADWKRLLARSKQLGCQRMLFAAILMARQLSDIHVPPDVSRLANQHTDLKHVVAELQDHLFQSFDTENDNAQWKISHFRHPRDYYTALTDSRLRRCRRRIAHALTPNDKDMATLRLPRTLSFLYYAIRPARLLMKLLWRDLLRR